ncbi:MAG: type II toxin-antitoxin system RelE/ParE family toxin [Nanoarchaeales archaeon]|nr:type II toxin-antitoxin system RelE/ParE family toxin [Nanoarchaeales archaeon]
MIQKITYSKLSQFDLDTLKIYISLNSNYSGLDFVVELVEYLDDLILFPNLGSDFDDNSKKLVYKKHFNVYYQILENEVIILRVLDSRRDF